MDRLIRGSPRVNERLARILSILALKFPRQASGPTPRRPRRRPPTPALATTRDTGRFLPLAIAVAQRQPPAPGTLRGCPSPDHA